MPQARKVARPLHATWSAGPKVPLLQSLDVFAPVEGRITRSLSGFTEEAGIRATKKDVKQKPQAFTDKGFVFVSINYRVQVWTTRIFRPA